MGEIRKSAAVSGGTYIGGYRYGYLENGVIMYFVAPLRIERKVGKRTLYAIVYNPTEAQLNAAGFYKVVNVAEDGEDYFSAEDNCIYHYVGAPIIVEDEEGDETQEP